MQPDKSIATLHRMGAISPDLYFAQSSIPQPDVGPRRFSEACIGRTFRNRKMKVPMGGLGASLPIAASLGLVLAPRSRQGVLAVEHANEHAGQGSHQG